MDDHEAVEIDTAAVSTVRVKCLGSVDMDGRSVARLGLGDGFQGQRRRACRRDANDLADQAPRQAADAQFRVQGGEAGWDDRGDDRG